MGRDQIQEIVTEQRPLDAMYARLDSEIAHALESRTSLLAASASTTAFTAAAM